MNRKWTSEDYNMNDYEVVIVSSVLLPGRKNDEPFERVITVYNARSATDARKTALRRAKGLVVDVVKLPKKR
jgi:hypothetical protein